jgi:hypothetical protein
MAWSEYGPAGQVGVAFGLAVDSEAGPAGGAGGEQVDGVGVGVDHAGKRGVDGVEVVRGDGADEDAALDAVTPFVGDRRPPGPGVIDADVVGDQDGLAP